MTLLLTDEHARSIVESTPDAVRSIVDLVEKAFADLASGQMAVHSSSRPDGVVVQHFNTGNDVTVKLINAEANLISAIGVDRGVGFEQLQVAPSYRNK